MKSDKDQLKKPDVFSYACDVDQNLICPICLNPFQDPISTLCQHTFCTDCITKLLDSGNPVCPVDRSPLNNDRILPASLAIQNMVNELLVFCTYRSQLCSWTGQRQFLQVHINNECEYTLEPCGLEGCSTMCAKCELDKHRKECAYRTISCPDCRQEMPFIKLTVHEQVCPDSNVSCELCCLAMKRHRLKTHSSQECPSRVISCRYQTSGCYWQGPFQKLDDHSQSCLYEKLSGFFDTYETREIEHQRQVLSLQARIDQLENELGMRGPVPDILSPESGSPSSSTTLININQELHFLERELQGLNGTLSSFMMQQDVRFLNEHARLREEIQSLRSICHTLQLQLIQSASSSSSRRMLLSSSSGGPVSLSRTDSTSSKSSPSGPFHDNKL